MDITTKKQTGHLMASIKAVKDETAPYGSFEAILSMPTVDRDGEVLDARCFEPLPDHITIDVDHAMTVEKTVASGQPFYDGEALKFKGTFASHPLAQMTRSLVDEGHIRTMSVAFINAQYEDDDGVPHLRKGELLNAGIVGIPSNREALITASKAFRDAALPDTRKSVVGSYEERREQLRDALRATQPLAQWVWVAATFDDRVVFEVETATSTETYEASYTINENGDIEIGEATSVELAEVVVPHKSPTDTTPETKTAAPAAVDSPAAVDVARAKATLAEAELALLD